MTECPLVVNIKKCLQTPFGDPWYRDSFESPLICQKRKPLTNVGYISAWNTPHNWCERARVSSNCFKSCFHRSSAPFKSWRRNLPQVAQMAPELFMIPPATAKTPSNLFLSLAYSLPLRSSPKDTKPAGSHALWCCWELGEQAAERSKRTPNDLKPGVVGKRVNLWSVNLRELQKIYKGS